MARALMIQGTGSNVGKSMLVAGLCRAAKRRNLNPAPFKPQNMSNNAAVTIDGGEIGRAQALQALACGLPLHSDMNPVLLKPQSETAAQVIVQGKRLGTSEAKDYFHYRSTLLDKVVESFNRLKSAHDLIIVEGAGSPAEVNLRDRDIANMGFAVKTQTPVILCGDIDRGGVIAQIVGTKEVLLPSDAALISGFIVNKFRGDPRLFDDGYDFIKERTNWQGYGVLPWFKDAWKLPAEDALDLNAPQKTDGIHIVCLCLPRIANFDDLDPLMQEKGVRLTMLGPGRALPADTDIVIIPGTKATRSDLAFMKAEGWDIDVIAHYRRGGFILGICGGYQILGQSINDPDGIEGPAGIDAGLGLLNIKTTMTSTKHLTNVTALHHATRCSFEAYEIHIGESVGPDRNNPFALVDGKPEGAISPCGRVTGSYLHGMFSSDEFRSVWLGCCNVVTDNRYSLSVEKTLDALSDHFENNLDLDAVFASAK